MFDSKARKFTFRCDSCKEITISEFEEESDIEDIIDDKLYIECPCGGKGKLLRD